MSDAEVWSDTVDAQFEAFLDEALPAAEMARLEQQLRESPALANRVAILIARRDAGVHSLGAIWRRHRLSCPPRSRLGSYLLDALADDEIRYIAFHIETIGCRRCQANLDDLRSQQAVPPETATRRQRYFQSSAGYLRPKK